MTLRHAVRDLDVLDLGPRRNRRRRVELARLLGRRAVEQLGRARRLRCRSPGAHAPRATPCRRAAQYTRAGARRRQRDRVRARRLGRVVAAAREDQRKSHEEQRPFHGQRVARGRGSRTMPASALPQLGDVERPLEPEAPRGLLLEALEQVDRLPQRARGVAQVVVRVRALERGRAHRHRPSARGASGLEHAAPRDRPRARASRGASRPTASAPR